MTAPAEIRMLFALQRSEDLLAHGAEFAFAVRQSALACDVDPVDLMALIVTKQRGCERARLDLDAPAGHDRVKRTKASASKAEDDVISKLARGRVA